MKIALIGGTGDIGEGLALRWGLETEHEILIGSRTKEKAGERAREYAERLESAGRKGKVSMMGLANEDAAREGDVVVLCVEAGYVVASVRSLLGQLTSDQIIVSPAVPMVRRGKFFFYAPPAEGSLAVQIAGVLPEDMPIVGAFHTVPAHKLADLDARLDQDVVVLGGNDRAKKTIMDLADEIPGIRPLDGGPLSASCLVESITPLLINLAIANKRKNLAVKFV
jgi:NADPH-dependent F420 reductase